MDEFQDLVVDGKAWGPEALDVGSGLVLEQLLACAEVFEQIVLVHLVAEHVVVAVGGDFVAAGLRSP